MSKSKYPFNLDTSAEIPPVRDNVLEIGSEVINSLRSAIFNIEKTLGINPQGSIGYTVAERLNRSLDAVGNLKSEVATITTITNSNISDYAAISESKLKLNYPTELLQDEISILNNIYQTLSDQIEELSSQLSIHINENAINRHPATAISIALHEANPSDTALTYLNTESSQSFFEKIIDQHIAYTGQNISAENNSHRADQIYFDNEAVSNILDTVDVQESIEALATLSQNSEIIHQDNLHSNGFLKFGKSTAINSEYGDILYSDISCTFSIYQNKITINSTTPYINNVKKSDIVTIIDPSDQSELIIGDYEIDSIITSDSNLIEIYIIGEFKGNSSGSTTLNITKSIKQDNQFTGLLITAREFSNLTSSTIIQISNPDAVAVKTLGIRPLEVTISNRYFNIVIDEDNTYLLDAYNGDVSRQTIDSIITKINEQVADNNYIFSAYRLDQFNSESELVIALNIPDSETSTHTIKITRATDDGIDALGFAYIEDLIIKSQYGINYYLSGNSYTGLKNKLNSSGELSFIASSTVITSSTSSVNFISKGIKSGDLITISGSESDDGTYVISTVTENQLLINTDQLPSGFTGNSASDTLFTVYSNSINLDNLTFDSVNSSYGGSLLEIFLDNNLNPNFTKIFEYEIPLNGTNALLTLIDYSGEPKATSSLILTESNDYIYAQLDDGNQVVIRAGNQDCWILSGESNLKLKISFHNLSQIISEINSSGGELEIVFYGSSKINADLNLILGTIPFNNFNGRLGSSISNKNISNKLSYGNIGLNEISTQALNKILEQPIFDLRSNGVISGLKISNASIDDSLYKFDIDGGVCYIEGKRFELKSYTDFYTDIDADSNDKIFIAVNSLGNIVVRKAVDVCNSPFNTDNHCLLATIENNDAELFNIDLRLFISDIDFRILNAITVSPVSSLAHFTSFSKAVKYAKRFSQLFPNAGYPSIHLKSGEHEVITIIDRTDISYSDWLLESEILHKEELYDQLINDGLVIDFPVNIIGEGSSSILNLKIKYKFLDETYTTRGKLGIIGDGFTSYNNPADKFTSGTSKYYNFTMSNCSIELVDLNIEDNATQYNFHKHIEQIYFDMTEFNNNPIDDLIGPTCISILDIDDTTNNKGNISILSCNFYIDESDADYIIAVPIVANLKNFTCCYNKIYSNEQDIDVKLFSNNILEFASAPSGSNIVVLGNVHASNFNESGNVAAPNIAENLTGWVDRIEHSLYVGGDISSELEVSANSIVSETSVEANSFEYSSEKSINKYIFFEDISDVARGNPTNVAEFDKITVNGIYWRTVKFADNTSDSGIFRLNINEGETLDDIVILFRTEDSSPTPTFSGFSYEIRSFTNNGDHAVESALASMGSITDGLGNLGETAKQTVSNINLAGASNKHYTVKLKRNSTSGYEQHLLYIKYTVNISNIQAIAGVF